MADETTLDYLLEYIQHGRGNHRGQVQDVRLDLPNLMTMYDFGRAGHFLQ